MDKLIRIILAIWVLLVYVLIVCSFGKRLSQLWEFLILVIFTLVVAFVLAIVGNLKIGG